MTFIWFRREFSTQQKQVNINSQSSFSKAQLSWRWGWAMSRQLKVFGMATGLLGGKLRDRQVNWWYHQWRNRTTSSGRQKTGKNRAKVEVRNKGQKRRDGREQDKSKPGSQSKKFDGESSMNASTIWQGTKGEWGLYNVRTGAGGWDWLAERIGWGTEWVSDDAFRVTQKNKC